MKDDAKKDRNAGKLFRSTGGYNNAVLNRGGDPESEFGLYGDAYHRAAKVLIERTASRGSTNSYDVCPIVFLYRQALELQLKAVILGWNAISRLQGKDYLGGKDIFQEHKLVELLKFGGRIIVDEMSWKDKFEEVGGYAAFKEIIDEFHRIDPRSDAFRYPANTNGESNKANHFAFDVRLLADRLEPILELLWAAADSLDDHYQGMCEQ